MKVKVVGHLAATDRSGPCQGGELMVAPLDILKRSLALLGGFWNLQTWNMLSS